MAAVNTETIPSLCDGLQGTLHLNHPLGAKTWMRVGGKADALFRPADYHSLREICRRAGENGIPLRTLGGGANLLVADEGVDGIVIDMNDAAFRGFQEISLSEDINAPLSLDPETGESVFINVSAGTDLAKLVMDTAAAGLAGLEMLTGVPGTLGGACRMNAGGKYGEIGNIVREITLIDMTGREHTYTRNQVRFSYRSSDLPSGVIISAVLGLRRDSPEEIHGRIKQIMAEKKQTQPLADRSAGCVFKNPLVDGVRVSAGKLIDLAGFKGTELGGASVSGRHANFIIPGPGCSAADIIMLINIIRAEVQRLHNVVLETELVIWKRNTAAGSEI